MELNKKPNCSFTVIYIFDFDAFEQATGDYKLYVMLR